MKLFSRKLTYEGRKAMYGRMFILPWIIGFILFFLIPIIQSLYFSFSQITMNGSGYKKDFIGLDNYKTLLFENAEFIRYLSTVMKDMAYEVPVIIAFSIFIAIILNQKFRGRTLARAIFFLPVIVTSGIIIHIIKQDIFASSIMNGANQQVYLFKSSGLQDMLMKTGINYKIIEALTEIIAKIFDLTWKSGVQILLFLSGLQTVPSSFYEAANMEGATKWECFWKITFPMVTPVIMVGIVYTIIDSFTYYNNMVMQLILDMMFKNIQYAFASAMSWVYFVCVMVVLVIVFRIIGKRVFYVEY